MDAERVEQFKRTLKTHVKGDVVILFMGVDPDAIGSAVGHEENVRHVLGTEWDGTVKIAYSGTVGKGQNSMLFNTFGLFDRFIKAEDLELNDNDVLMLVDSSQVNDGRAPKHLQNLDPIVVIDHHRGSDLSDEETRFFWVEEIGAASTLVSELGEALGVSYTNQTRMLLAIGIYNDTVGLGGGADKRDVTEHAKHRCAVLAKGEDDDSPSGLSELLEVGEDPSYLEAENRALSSMEVHGSKAVLNAGELKEDELHYVAKIANHVLKQNKALSFVVVWGNVGSTGAQVTARSSDKSVSMREFLRERFSENSGGAFIRRGNDKGGAFVHFGPFADSNDEETLKDILGAFGKIVKERVFA